MIPKNYSDEGIVLARRNYGEADRIIPIYTKNFGKLTFIAKGVRRPKSKKRGHIEIFTRLRFSAVKGKGMDILTEVETINSYALIRSDLRKVSLAYYFMEVIGKITHEGEPHIEVYSQLVHFLDKLEIDIKLKTLRKNFISEILVSLGFWPLGKPLPNPDEILEEVIERKLYSVRVGKQIM